jgi:nucleoside-diphosphate-sugar epimerase
MLENHTPLTSQCRLEAGDGLMNASHTPYAVLGAGPVGRALVAEISARGDAVSVLTRSGTQVGGATAARLDVRDAEALAGALRRSGVRVVFQSAQPEYHRWPEEFPQLQAAIVDACERAGARLVVVENLYGYGRVAGPITEGLPLSATTRKGAVRARMWHDLEAAHRAGRVQVTAVRASDFVGPGVTASTFGDRFFDPLVAGKAAEVYGPLDVRHSVTYVPDLARAMVELSRHDRAYGRAWHAPNAPAVTVGELVELTARIAGVEPRTRRVRPWQLRLAGLFIPAARESVEMVYEFTDDFVVDDRAIRDEFGVDHTTLDEAIAAIVADRTGSIGVAA